MPRIIVAASSAPADTSCVGVLCQPGLTCVQGACVDLSCVGVLCEPGMACVGGACQPIPSSATPVSTAPFVIGAKSRAPGNTTTTVTRTRASNPGDTTAGQSNDGGGTTTADTPQGNPQGNPIGVLGLAAAAALFLFKIKLVF